MNGAVDFVEQSLRLGEHVLANRDPHKRKTEGQFLTSPQVARSMALALGPISKGARILEPAVGSGTLACAIIERLITEGAPTEVWIEGYDIDHELCLAARQALMTATGEAAAHGVTVHFDVHEQDFVLDYAAAIQPTLFTPGDRQAIATHQEYTHIIANPPYFKLPATDPRTRALSSLVEGSTNIYTVFMALAIQLLAANGRACFIVPRSFCSGAYFAAFRRDFIQQAVPMSVHLLESREDAFKNDSVLQENVIITFRRRLSGETGDYQPAFVNISASPDTTSLDDITRGRPVSIRHFLCQTNGELFFRLPTSELDEQVIDIVQAWDGNLGKCGMEVSTGPVVAFRARRFLTGIDSVYKNEAVPLLWMQNVKSNQVTWPLSTGKKPQGLVLTHETKELLLPLANYVLVRRFSAKEEPRRLVAAPFIAGNYGYGWVGLENHLNYIRRKHGHLHPEEAAGLAALFNSAVLDRYFRIVNGNTQVNAAELRAMPLPPLEQIKRIGEQVMALGSKPAHEDANSVTYNTLKQARLLPDEFPLMQETRLTMGKIQQAQEILQTLGLPRGQWNEVSALTLLVLAQLSEKTPWSKAASKSLRVHDILVEIKERYKREYAENTRESIRRQVLHQFEQAGLVNRNPDEPTLSTNSPRTHYALTSDCLDVLRTYKTQGWLGSVKAFAEARGSLFSIYQHNRKQNQVPLQVATGQTYYLSPGKHNMLQAAVVNEFGPRFAPGAQLLYLGDTAKKILVLDKATLQKLGVLVTRHGKLPDIIFYDTAKDRLFLVEVVTSHGPISPKRYNELEKLLGDCKCNKIYVTAFLDFTTFKNHLVEIAWDTEVWLAEMPDHMIHFNGDHFLARPDRSN